MKMSHSRLISVAFVTVLVLAAVAVGAARAGELEDALPEDTFLLVKVLDWSKAWKSAETTALGKIFAEQEVRECTAGPRKVFEKFAAAMEKKGVLKPGDFRKAFGSEAAVVMPGLREREGADAGDAPAFALGLLAKVTDAEAAGRAAAALQMLVKKEAQDRGGACKELAWGGIKVFRAGPADDDDEGLRVYLFRAGDYQALVLSNSEPEAKRLAEGLAAGKCAKPLSAAADYRQCRARLGEGPDLVWYLGIKKLMDQVLARIPEDDRGAAAKVLEALKLADLAALAGSVAVEPPGFRSRAFLACKAGAEGLPGLLDVEPLAPEMLKLAPAGAVLMQAGRFRFDRLMPLARKALAAATEGGLGDLDEEMLKALNEELGFDVEKDLLAALDRQLCVIMLPGKSIGGNALLGELNGLVAAVEVKDPAALRKTAGKLVEAVKANAELEDAAKKGLVSDFEYRGVKVTSFNLGLASPGFAITDKHLLMAVNVQAIKKLLPPAPDKAGAGGEAAPRLTDSEAFKKAMAAGKLDPAGACGVSYVDSAELAAGLFAKVGLAGGLSKIAGGLGLGRSGGRSKSELRQIGLACHLWADDNDEAFPPDLLKLFPDYVDNKKLLLCQSYAKHAADGVDYAYVAGLRAADSGETILAYETLPGPDGTVNVLYCDAHVAAVKLDEVKKNLEAQAKKLKEAKRTVKLIEPQGVARGGEAEAEPEFSLESLASDFLLQALRPEAIPPMEAVTKHLFPGVSVTRKTQDGVLVESFSPTGLNPNLGNATVAAAAVLPWLFMARGAAMPEFPIAPGGEGGEVPPVPLPLPVPVPKD